jgi:uncharacterized protein with PIN domain
MKQFVITIPNPVRGKGARGFDRKPKRGEPTFSIFHCYAQSEKRARELTAGYFSMRKVPDGTKFVEIVSDPRVKQESFADMRLMAAPIVIPMQEEAPARKKFELVVVQRAVQQDTAVYEVEATTEEEARELYANFISTGEMNNINLTDTYSYYCDHETPQISVAELITDGNS